MALRELMAKGKAKVVRLYRRRVDGESLEALDASAEDRVSLTFVGCVPDGDELVIRTRALARAFSKDPDLSYSLEDMEGHPIPAKTVILGETLLEECETGVASWEVMASTRVARSAVPLRMRVSDATGELAEASRCLNKRRRRRLVYEWRKQSKSAWDDARYDAWFKRHRADAAELERQAGARFACEPLVSIVVPLFNTPVDFFEEMAKSVIRQSYANWELVLVNASPDNAELAAAIEALTDERVRVIALNENKGIVTNTNEGIRAAKGDFVAFLDHDDLLEPDALYRYVEAINGHDGVDLLYCDEDSYSPGGRFVHPHFKSDFNRDLLYAHNYITHFLMARASVVEEAGLSPDYVEGAQDYDLTLRVVERARVIAHIPRVLYHWRVHAESTSANAASKSYAQEAGRRALRDHFARRGLDVAVRDGQDAFTYIEHYRLGQEPLVSIVIPSKDHVDVLSACVRSILEKATYENYEIVIVENNSVEDETFAYYDEIAADDRVRIVKFEGAFNYSRVINFGVSRAKGEYLFFLNNDTEVITPDFIERMLGFFVRGEVGVVGAKLLHCDGTIQHAGVVIGPFDEPWHLFMEAPDGFRGYMGRANLTQDYAAVTGACQMVSRSLFDEVGGYDEEFAIAYNDIDFCLKARACGKLVVYDAQTKLHHREFTSRGRDVSPEALARFLSEKALLHSRWPRYFSEGDPHYNCNLEKDSLFFALGR